MANGLQGLFGATSLGGGLNLYSAIFPILFGTGAAGAVTLGTIADAGYMGAFGANQYTSCTLPAGLALTIAPGSSNGGLLLACQGTFTLAGSIVANGSNGGNAVFNTSSGAGGATAGGGLGCPAVTAPQTGSLLNPGLVPSRIGHGCLPNTSMGAGAGVFAAENGTNSVYTAANVLADTIFPPLGCIDAIRGVRAGPPGGSPAAVVSATVGAETATQARTVGNSTLYAANTLQSLSLLPSGLPGQGGTAWTGAGGTSMAGGGGGGGGLVYIEANTIVFQAGHSIQANGGNGGSGAGFEGGGGGGMGGDGGLVVLIANQFIGTPNVSVSGGAGGTTYNQPGGVMPAALASLAGRFLMIQV
jgi:hypothetical protein